MAELQKNIFAEGLDTDADIKTQKKSTLRDAVNVDLFSNGKIGALSNIKGTSRLNKLTSLTNVSNVNCLGSYEVTADINGTNTPCIVIFWKDGNTNRSSIFLFDLVKRNNHILLSTSDSNPDTLKFPIGGTVDLYYNSERTENIAYFVDFENPIRKLELKIPFTQTIKEMVVRQLSPVDSIQVDSVESGGNTPAGTYQFAYRYFNTVTRKTSAFSLLTQPIPVMALLPGEPAASDTDFIVGGVAGDVTDKKFVLTINKTPDNSANFDAIQVAVVRHIEGSKDPTTVADLLSPSKTIFDNPSGFDYTGLEEATAIPIEDIVVEDAPINTGKTINQKDNRLFIGNVKYNDLLDYDNGDPVFEDAFAVNNDITGESAYKNPLHYKNRGYFREEVYRFGITYTDGFGNWSPPFPYDFSNVTRIADDTSRPTFNLVSVTFNSVTTMSTIKVAGNQTAVFIKNDLLKVVNSSGAADYFKVGPDPTFDGTNTSILVQKQVTATVPGPNKVSFAFGDSNSHAVPGIPDFKFPDRSIAEHTLLDDTDKISSLGLKITKIKNHPSWAKGFAIVRMNRIKNILWQTPQVSTVAYEGVNSVAAFFDETTDYDGTRDHVGIKKFGMGTARNIVNTSEDIPDIAGRVLAPGQTGAEVVAPVPQYFAQQQNVDHTTGFGLAKEVSRIIWAIPPEYMYNDAGVPFEDYIHSSAHKVRIVDAVIWKRTTKVGNTALSASQGVSDNSFANIYRAIDEEQYYYRRADNRVDLSGQDSYHRRIETLSWFDDVAQQNTNTTRALNRLVNHNSFTLPESPFDDSFKLDGITKWGEGSSLTNAQFSDPYVTDSGTSNISDHFGNPVENQRGIILYLENPIEDFSYRVSQRLHVNSENYFPNVMTAVNMPSTVYTDVHLDDASNLTPFISVPPFPTDEYYVKNNFAATNGQFVGGSYIFNIIAGLGDDRYGALDAANQFIFTGHYQPLTPDDIVSNTEFDVEVFGGDCFITKTAIKVNNSANFLVNYDPAGIDDQTGAGNSEYKVGSYEDYVEILEYYVESEVNVALNTERGIYNQTGDFDVTIETYNTTYFYSYNPDYSEQNKLKIFTSHDSADINPVHFPARMAYSDQRVYQTNIDGFDRFRALNIFDLEEQYGGITRLVKTSDGEITAVQESAVRYIPIGKEITELQEGTKQFVSSANVIGNVEAYLSTTRGSQHIRTVQVEGDNVYMVDAKKREVLMFQGRSNLQNISKLGMYSFFNDQLQHDLDIPETVLMGAYDFDKGDYWIVYNSWTDTETVKREIDVFPPQGDIITNPQRGGFSILFSQSLGRWKSKIDVGNDTILSPVYANQHMHTVARIESVSADSAELHEWYTSPKFGHLHKSYRDSTFDIMFNDGSDSNKIHDVIYINATNRLDRGDFTVFNENADAPDQIASNVNLNVNPRDGKYVINDIRDDSRGGRLRGQAMEGKFKITNSLNNDREVVVTSILNKYRISQRNF